VTFTPKVSLTVTKAGAGAGTVTSSPAGISCGSTCSAVYASGMSVTLTATPAAGSTFTGWSGGVCSGTGACTVTMSAARTVTATFGAAPAIPPAAPTNVTVRRLTTNTSGATFEIGWSAASGATSYGYFAAFGDGTGQRQGTTAATSVQITMPYHSSGAAATGFVCVRSIGAAGQSSVDQGCNSLSVPARP
jgi:Divergent InlB B-repeat domain